jgi:hypothetical protein
MNFVYGVTVLIRQAGSDVASWKPIYIHNAEAKNDTY